jgi:hypothetical protein
VVQIRPVLWPACRSATPPTYIHPSKCLDDTSWHLDADVGFLFPSCMLITIFQQNYCSIILHKHYTTDLFSKIKMTRYRWTSPQSRKFFQSPQFFFILLLLQRHVDHRFPRKALLIGRFKKSIKISSFQCKSSE